MPLGLEGYCPVTLAEKGVWTEGRAQWGVRHRGRTYLFAGPEQQQPDGADPLQVGQHRFQRLHPVDRSLHRRVGHVDGGSTAVGRPDRHRVADQLRHPLGRSGQEFHRGPLIAQCGAKAAAAETRTRKWEPRTAQPRQ
jgi:hypothetical protein